MQSDHTITVSQPASNPLQKCEQNQFGHGLLRQHDKTSKNIADRKHIVTWGTVLISFISLLDFALLVLCSAVLYRWPYHSIGLA